MTVLLPHHDLTDPPTAPRPAAPSRTEPAPAHRAPVPHRSARGPALLVALVLAANAVVAFDLHVPVLRPVAGLVGLALVPGLVAVGELRRRRVPAPEHVLYAVTAVVLAVLVGGLAVNVVGPAVGVDAPLEPRPLAVVSAVVSVALVCWRWRHLPVPRVSLLLGPLVRPVTVAGLPVLAAATGAVLAVLGAIRLDNGAGGAVATAALVLGGAGLAGAFLARGSVVRDAWVLFLAATGLLLGTSLRSWYVVGHDVLREFFFFELTQHAGYWNIGAYPDPYNACLSVTILPTVLVSFTGLSGAFVFKVLLQLVFALVPVATYVLGRRVLPRSLALVGAVFVLSFPTFWADMPYLVRQEVAFLFLAVCLLAATQPGRRRATRLTVALGMACGVVLSHYSTTYVLTLTVALAMAAHGVRRLRRSRRVDDGVPARSEKPVLLSLPMLAALGLMAFSWTGPVTHTGSHFESVLSSTVAAVAHPGRSLESSDLAYALLPTHSLSPQQRLDAYSHDAQRQSGPARKAGQLLPLGHAARHLRAAPRADEPPTALGRWVTRHTGLGLDHLNEALRGGVARLLQLFLLLGVAASLWRKGATRGFPDELRWLGLGATLALALTVLAPGLSVEYGVLRAFQQALLILAPATAAGCALLMRPLRRSGHRLAAVVAVAAFAVLTGLAGQALGGSSPQLHVANTGLYYDLYYRTPQDAAGIVWLDGVLDQRAPGRRAPAVSSDLPTMGAIAIHRRSYDGLDDQVFPALLERHATVFLDTTTVRDDRSAISYGGDVVPYRYPIGLLERTKSRVYDNGSARVYR